MHFFTFFVRLCIKCHQWNQEPDISVFRRYQPPCGPEKSVKSAQQAKRGSERVGLDFRSKILFPLKEQRKNEAEDENRLGAERL